MLRTVIQTGRHDTIVRTKIEGRQIAVHINGDFLGNTGELEESQLNLVAANLHSMVAAAIWKVTK